MSWSDTSKCQPSRLSILWINNHTNYWYWGRYWRAVFVIIVKSNLKSVLLVILNIWIIIKQKRKKLKTSTCPPCSQVNLMTYLPEAFLHLSSLNNFGWFKILIPFFSFHWMGQSLPGQPVRESHCLNMKSTCPGQLDGSFLESCY